MTPLRKNIIGAMPMTPNFIKLLVAPPSKKKKVVNAITINVAYSKSKLIHLVSLMFILNKLELFTSLTTLN